MLTWYHDSLGTFYALAIPAAGLLAFALTLLLVIRGGRYAASALGFIVPLPLLLGWYGGLANSAQAYEALSAATNIERL